MFKAINEFVDSQRNKKSLKLIRIVNLDAETDTVFKELFDKYYTYNSSVDHEHKVCIELIPEIVFNKKL
jgi:hypothetical protein